MGKTAGRADKALAALIKRTQKDAAQAPSVPDKEKVNYVNRSAEHDPLIKDAPDGSIFEEMKRRDF